MRRGDRAALTALRRRAGDSGREPRERALPSPRARLRRACAWRSVVVVLLALTVAVAIGIVRGGVGAASARRGRDRRTHRRRRPRRERRAATSAMRRVFVHVLGAVARARPVRARATAPGGRRGRRGGRLPRRRRSRRRSTSRGPLSDGEQLDVPAVGEAPAPRPGAAPAGDGTGQPQHRRRRRARHAAAHRAGDGRSASSTGATRTAASRASRTCSRCPGIGDKMLEALRDLVTVVIAARPARSTCGSSRAAVAAWAGRGRRDRWIRMPRRRAPVLVVGGCAAAGLVRVAASRSGARADRRHGRDASLVVAGRRGGRSARRDRRPRSARGAGAGSDAREAAARGAVVTRGDGDGKPRLRSTGRMARPTTVVRVDASRSPIDGRVGMLCRSTSAAIAPVERIAIGVGVRLRRHWRRADARRATCAFLVFARGRPRGHARRAACSLVARTSCRPRFARRRATGLPGPGAGLLPGLAVGDTTRGDAELDAAMKACSLSHLTAVSGANCAIVVGLAFAARRGARAAAAGVRVGVGARGARRVRRAGHTASRASCAPAAMAGVALLVARARSRRRGGIAVLSLAVIVLLVVDPWLAAQLRLRAVGARDGRPAAARRPARRGARARGCRRRSRCCSRCRSPRSSPASRCCSCSTPALPLYGVAGEPARRARRAGRDGRRAARVPARARRCPSLGGRGRRGRVAPGDVDRRASRDVPSRAARAPGCPWPTVRRASRCSSLRRRVALLVACSLGAGPTRRAGRRGARRRGRRRAYVGGASRGTRIVAELGRARPTGSSRSATSGRATPTLVRSAGAIALVDTGPEPEPLERASTSSASAASTCSCSPTTTSTTSAESMPSVGRVDTVLIGPRRRIAGDARSPTRCGAAGARRRSRSSRGEQRRRSATLDWRVLWPPPGAASSRATTRASCSIVRRGAGMRAACAAPRRPRRGVAEPAARCGRLGPRRRREGRAPRLAPTRTRALYEALQRHGRPDRRRRRQRLRASDRRAARRILRERGHHGGAHRLDGLDRSSRPTATGRGCGSGGAGRRRRPPIGLTGTARCDGCTTGATRSGPPRGATRGEGPPSRSWRGTRCVRRRSCSSPVPRTCSPSVRCGMLRDYPARRGSRRSR